MSTESVISIVIITLREEPFLERTLENLQSLQISHEIIISKSVVDYLFSLPLNWFYIISNNIFHSGNSSGEFQMVRMDAFRKIGGSPPELAAGEDNELFRRLATIGRTMSYWKLCVRHSLRRPHKLGWLRTYFIWIKNGLSVALRNKAAYKEWSVVR